MSLSHSKTMNSIFFRGVKQLLLFETYSLTPGACEKKTSFLAWGFDQPRAHLALPDSPYPSYASYDAMALSLLALLEQVLCDVLEA